ncbi:MAG TPA: GNAT family N-acetyltransferase [Vicinamibacterales bacterium]|nr:GNAT family N-acetyltransferase [Vicinamibacterales bacterium]
MVHLMNAVSPDELRSATVVEIIDRPSDFEALRPQWNELLSASATASPFLTWEWVYAWWTHLGERSRLNLFVVRTGGQIVAIAPLRIARRPLTWLSSLEFLGTGAAGSDYLDLIVRRGCEAVAVEALAGAFQSQGLTLRLSHLPPGSLALRLAGQMEHGGWTSREAEAGVCPFIRLAGHTWESYLASLGSAHRANVRRRIREVARTFDVRFELVAGSADRLDVLAALAAFHDRRWSGDRGSTTFATPELHAFHQDATRRALDAGYLRLYGLRLDGQLAGAMYAFSHAGRFYFYQHGFDQRYRQYSLGLFLMALTIRAAIDEGAVEFDLLYGIESYKRLWTAETRPLGRLDLFPARVGGRLHRRRVDAESALRALAQRMRSRDGHAA